MVRLGVALVVVLALSATSGAQGAEPKKLTLDVTDDTLAEVVLVMSEASGVTILATDTASQSLLSLSLPEGDVETAVQAVAQAIDGSWLRTYVIEPAGQEPPEETAADIIGRLQVAWRDWMLSRTDEELDAFRERALASMGGPPIAPQPTAGGGMMFDVVEMLQAPFHAERISLKVEAVDVRQALGQFTLGCGYTVLLSPEVTGQVSLDATDEELSAILDALCEPVNAQWRPLYLIGKAREVSSTEMEQRFTQMLEQGVTEFWKQPPEDRARIVQRIADRMANIPPEVQTAVKNSPWTSRLMGRAMQFVFTLTPDQRREIAPILQGAVKLFGQ
ncbi:MAG: hypothetical protein FJX74_14100 [Armatimonadetes bacterium]|nr:hypothetical protein [Armatimonadota bacterium]